MDAIEAVILVRLAMKEKPETSFRGFVLSELEYQDSIFECDGCLNICEIINLLLDGALLGYFFRFSRESNAGYFAFIAECKSRVHCQKNIV
ncbi:MAG: hypothetical protein R6U91_05590 [Bacillota bacterium]